MDEKHTNLFSIVGKLESKKKERQERDLQEFTVFLGSVMDEVFAPLRERPSVRYVGKNKDDDDTLMIVRDDIQQRLIYIFMRTAQFSMMKERIARVLELLPNYFDERYQFANKENVLASLQKIVQRRLAEDYPDVQV